MRHAVVLLAAALHSCGRLVLRGRPRGTQEGRQEQRRMLGPLGRHAKALPQADGKSFSPTKEASSKIEESA